MTSLHTPTPWTVAVNDEAGYPHYEIPELNVRINGSRWHKIADSIDFGKADAEFIVHCVNNYDALVVALKLILQSHDASCVGEACPLTGIDLARAAIAKAEAR